MIFNCFFLITLLGFFGGETIETCINQCKNSINALNDWCDHNRLFINWEKRFVMFITNKSVVLPKSVTLNKIEVKAVNNFKLLGNTLDNKLNFFEHVLRVYISINRKTFEIKRLFYLSFSVRRQLVKKFILSFFDFGCR